MARGDTPNLSAVPGRDHLPMHCTLNLGSISKGIMFPFLSCCWDKKQQNKTKTDKKQLEKEKDLLNIILPGHCSSLREESGQELKARTRAESMDVYFLACTGLTSFFI